MTMRWCTFAVCAVLGLAACRGGEPVPGGSRPLTILYPGDERILGPYWEMPAKFPVLLPLVLEANPDYFRGAPRIARVVLKFGDRLTLPEALSGNVDALGFANAADMRLKDENRYRVTWEIGTAARGIMWNARHPLFRDAAVRRAPTLAIDRRELHALLGCPPDIRLPDGPVSDRQFRRGDYGEMLLS